MKMFHFYRIEDQSGVSGTGPVVEGVEFTNGWCALRWLSNTSSICFYRSLEEVRKIHGHGGRTEIVVHDFEPLNKRVTQVGKRHFEILMEIIEEAARITSLAEEGGGADPQYREAIAHLRDLVTELESGTQPKLPASA